MVSPIWSEPKTMSKLYKCYKLKVVHNVFIVNCLFEVAECARLGILD